jgi:hypothetical protein
MAMANGRELSESPDEARAGVGHRTPTRAELARLDRKRRKKGANDDWTDPHDPEAKITKMKDGRMHLARLERPFAHLYETGGMRRVHLRGDTNIRKRLLIHTAGFNLGLLMRQLIGVGTPRGLQGRLIAVVTALLALIRSRWDVLRVRVGPQNVFHRSSTNRSRKTPSCTLACGKWFSPRLLDLVS